MAKKVIREEKSLKSIGEDGDNYGIIAIFAPRINFRKLRLLQQGARSEGQEMTY